MAWPSVTVTSGGSATPAPGVGTLTFSHTCPAGHTKLVVLVATGGSGGVDVLTGITYNSVALTRKISVSDGAFERAQIWELDSPTTGSAQNVVISYSTGASGVQFGYGSISFDGAAAATGTASSNTGSTANPSVTVADSANGDIVVSVVANDNAAAAQSPSTGTVIFDFEDIASDSDFTAQYQTATGTNTVCTFTQSDTTGGSWAIVGVAIKQAGGGGSSNSLAWIAA